MHAPALSTIGLAAAALAAAPLGASAHTVHAKLDGYQETPASISTAGSGEFRAKIREKDNAVEWELSYEGMQGNVLQAHIHFGQAATSGGIAVFLCTNLPNSPGTQACPQSGTNSCWAGELAELIRAIRAGAAYANVHTSLVPSGEIRGQLK